MLPILPSKCVYDFHLVSFNGMDDSHCYVSNEDWINLPFWDGQKAWEHMNASAAHLVPNTLAFLPLSPAHSITTGAMSPACSGNARAMPEDKVSDSSFMDRSSKNMLPVATKMEPNDDIMMEPHVKDELELDKMPVLKRFKMTTLSVSENSGSDMSMGFTSPISPEPSSLSAVSEQNTTGSTGLMPKAMPDAHSFSTNPLCQSQPLLGLALRKSPSLVELIERKLAQGDDALPTSSGVLGQMENKARKCNTSLHIQQDKHKASNFSASYLRIGAWEFVAKYEGDLVAKFYYAKRKLVWEILNNRLKSKVEIQWSDITALNASCRENQPDMLEIEISQPPLFFKEINPQPKKHTLWQSTSDFTGGQATVCKQHYLKSPPGLLNRHYERLLQCDPRLKALSESSASSGSLFSLDNPSKKTDGSFEHPFQPPLQGEMHSVVQRGNSGSKCAPPFGSLNKQLPGSVAVLKGSLPMAHLGLVPKFEAVEIEDMLTEWPVRAASFSAPGLCQDDNIGMDSGGFQSSKHVGSGKADCIRETAAPGIVDQKITSFLETQKGPSSGNSQPSNWKKLDEISRILLEEPYRHLPVSAETAVLSSFQHAYNSFQPLNHCERKTLLQGVQDNETTSRRENNKYL